MTNELTARREENGLRVYRYLLNDLTRSYSVTVNLAKDGKIADLQLEKFNQR